MWYFLGVGGIPPGVPGRGEGVRYLEPDTPAAGGGDIPSIDTPYFPCIAAGKAADGLCAARQAAA